MSEPDIDTGGPSKEFWHLFADGVMTSYCIGNDHQEYFFNKNVPALRVITTYSDCIPSVLAKHTSCWPS